MACALYIACRQSAVPASDKSTTIEGNCVSLTSLLRKTKLRSFSLPFFDFRILHIHIKNTSELMIDKNIFELNIPMNKIVAWYPNESK